MQMNRKLLLSVGLLTLLCAPVAGWAAEYNVDRLSSTVAFAGQHAGANFTGQFTKWHAEIDFDPADLASSSFTATIDMDSADTGNPMYNGTLPTKDWFNVKEFPKGTFRSTGFAEKPDGRFTVDGLLTLRGQEHPVSFDFTLSDLTKDPVTATATFPVDRLAYGIGAESDAKAEWVSKEIMVTLNIAASPKPAGE